MEQQASFSGGFHTKNVRFADKVANACYKKYKELPRRGKPNKREWTLLAGIVKVHGWSRTYEQEVERIVVDVVSLGTGSKCIGQTKLSEDGDIINDSHAEIMARRGFLRYLYEQIQKHFAGKSDIFEAATPRDGIKCTVRKDITFHFFTSHTPCGDASIFPKPPFGDMEESLDSSEECDFDENVESCDTSSGGACSRCGGDIGDSGTTESSDSNPEYSMISGRKSDIPVGAFGISCAAESSDSTEDYALSFKQTCNLPLEDYEIGGPIESSDSNQEYTSKCKRKSNIPMKGSKTKQFKMSPIESTTKLDIFRGQTSTQKGLLSLESDIYRTGAKCLKTEPQQDMFLPGSEYHVVGPVRTKPGRGDPTLSVSCSDKFARWNAVGVQGALLTHFLSAPIYLQSIVIAGDCPYSEEALRRAIIERVGKHILNLDHAYSVGDPIVVQSTIPFADAKAEDDERNPCPSSIVWSCVKNRCLEVAVGGKKQGATKKASQASTSRLAICKKELLKQFVNIVVLLKKKGFRIPFLPRVLEDNFQTQATYKFWKLRAEDYQHAWNRVRVCAFPSWSQKPDYLVHFTANEPKEPKK